MAIGAEAEGLYLCRFLGEGDRPYRSPSDAFVTGCGRVNLVGFSRPILDIDLSD